MEKYPDPLKLDMSEIIKKFQALKNLGFGSFDSFLENLGNEIDATRKFMNRDFSDAFKSSSESDIMQIISDLSRINEQSVLLQSFVDDLYFGLRHWNRVKNFLFDMESFSEKQIKILKNNK